MKVRLLFAYVITLTTLIPLSTFFKGEKIIKTNTDRISPKNDKLIEESIDASCFKENINYGNIEEVVNMRISIPESRKWNSNLIRAYMSESHHIIDKFKRRYKAQITYNVGDEECSSEALIRVSGDWKDHVTMLEGNPVASIDIKLLNNHLNGLVRFKLFLPKTRNYISEVITANLFKELGMLSPRTKLIDVEINGVNLKMILQEKIAKEFMEYNNLRESIVLETDESMLWDLRAYSNNAVGKHYNAIIFPKVVNDNWVNRSHVNEEITINALKNYANVILDSTNNKSLHQEKPYSIKLLDPNRKYYMNDDHELFTIISIISNSTHGLYNHNRKFYFDAFEDRLLPIYYDGDSTLGLNYNNFDKIVDLDPAINYNDPHISELSRQLNKENINYSINKLKKIDVVKFKEKLNRSGVEIKSDEVKEIIISLIKNAELLKSNIRDLKLQNINSETRFVYSDIPIDFGIAFMSTPFNIYLCDKDINSCTEKVLTNSEFRKLSKGELSINGKQYFYRYSSFDKYIKNTNTSDKVEEYKSLKLAESINLRVYGEPLIDINKKSRVIKFKTVTPMDKVVIHNSYLEGWTIQIDSEVYSDGNQNKPRIDKYLLTGLLTIQDSNLKSLKISIANGRFEDSLNIIRSKGSIDKINIKNSYQDALDLDFSDLKIDHIEIINSGNDCIDLSGGNYYINKIEAYVCKDKGISIGENSNAVIELAIIKEAKTGLVSKDSSKLVINDGQIQETSICISAYRKKQEFNGGYAQVNKGICEESIIRVQKNSLLEYK